MVVARLLVAAALGIYSCLAQDASAADSLAASNSKNVTVTTDSAIYNGVAASDNVTAIFYGIPYAEPPLGKLRFKAPVPVSTSGPRKTYDARTRGNICVQGPLALLVGGDPGSEDCLHVNVYTPKTAVTGKGDKPKYPVIVWIHGGAFIYGDPLFTPYENWIEQFPNTVVVQVYYRLGAWGFMNAPPDAKDAGLDYNAGFLDQRQALKWVKQNIGAFGGDSSKVTIQGESAGATSTWLHLVAYDGQQDLFRGAIAQSPVRPAFLKPADYKDFFAFYAGAAGCGAPTSNAAKVECLRGQNVTAITTAVGAASQANASWAFSPILDGKVFTDTPTQLLKKGKFAKVPVIVGANTNDNLARSANLTAEVLTIYPSASAKDIATIQSLYPIGPNGYPNATKSVEAAWRDLVIRCTADNIAQTYAAAGLPTYLYRFDQPNPFSVPPLEPPPSPNQNLTVVAHAAELYWMFNGSYQDQNFNIQFNGYHSPSELRFSQELIAYWVSLAQKGDPNQLALSGSPRWPALTKSSTPLNRLRLKKNDGTQAATGSSVEVESAADNHLCQVLTGFAANFRF